VGVILLWVCVFPRESQNPVGVALLYSYCRTGNSVWLWALPPRPPALTDTAPQTTPTGERPTNREPLGTPHLQHLSTCPRTLPGHQRCAIRTRGGGALPPP
jgi:hypothetical protein